MLSCLGVTVIAGAAVLPAGIFTSKPVLNKVAIAAGSVTVTTVPLTSV